MFWDLNLRRLDWRTTSKCVRLAEKYRKENSSKMDGLEGGGAGTGENGNAGPNENESV